MSPKIGGGLHPEILESLIYLHLCAVNSVPTPHSVPPVAVTFSAAVGTAVAARALFSLAAAGGLTATGAATTKAEAGSPPGLRVSSLQCMGHSEQQHLRRFGLPLRHSQPARLPPKPTGQSANP